MRTDNPGDSPRASAAADKAAVAEAMASSSDGLSHNSGAANSDAASNATAETAILQERSANGRDPLTVAEVQAAVADAQSYISALNKRLEHINADSDEKQRR